VATFRWHHQIDPLSIAFALVTPRFPATTRIPAHPSALLRKLRLRLTVPPAGIAHPMITGEIKSKVDRIWDTLWSGGISNPLTIIEQLTYLLFIKRLDEIHTLKENKANRLKKPIEEPIFSPKQDKLR
jgi:hypothetical protein